ncbi:MAG: ArgE/DapE family deacylase [Chloroflexota bacterium]
MDIRIDRDLVIGLTRDLVRFRSVNPPGDEQPVAEFLAARMKDLGMESELQIIDDGRANVVGRLKGSGDGHLVFTGHLDVVPPGGQEWRHPPFDADMVDGRIYGRGSCDMKGGVAAIVAAASALIVAGFRPRADFIVAATAGEEAGMIGAQAMVERASLRGSRYLVVAEPSDLDVFVAEKGVLWLTIRALGKTAHGSMPWLGVNAVSFMSRLIARLEEYPFTYDESELLGKPSLSVNVISGGNKTNVVPDVCEIEVDMRTVPSQNNQQVVDAARDLAEDMARDFHPDLRIEIEIGQDKQSLETDRGEHLVGTMIQAVTDVRGAPRVGGVTYGTDAAALGPGFNIPMVICGPGAQGMAHQPDEYVEVEQLVQAAEIYAHVAQTLLG